MKSIEMLPKFKYYIDPQGTKTFVKSKKECPICGKKTGYKYNGEFYAVDEVDNICPWCIADGSAAKKFDGTFHDINDNPDIAEEKRRELMERTPGIESMQPLEWPCHCDDYCAFVDKVGWKEIVKCGLENELSDDIENLRNEFGFEDNDFRQMKRKNSSLIGYLFRCTICGKHKLTVDVD